MKINYIRTILIVFTSALVLLAGWCGLQIHRLSSRREEIKKEYSLVNNITFGILSANTWRDNTVKVVTTEIDNFTLTPGQKDTIKQEIENVLHSVINKVDTLLNKKQKTLGGKLKKFAIKTLVDKDDVQKKVPALAETVVEELLKPKSRAKLKSLAKTKLEELGSETYDSSKKTDARNEILKKHHTTNINTYNKQSESSINALENKTYNFVYIILGILVLFLLLWWLLKKTKAVHTPLYIVSVILAFVTLLVGLTSPMIEIDARINKLDFTLLGQTISFHNQVVFFQSKSIVDVVQILIKTGKVDSILVGILILVFSIVFPVAKLLSTEIYLLAHDKWKKNKLIHFFAFKSGKWSMADVSVVAIFMSYIGFKGILDDQLSDLNVNTETISSISTNHTSLQPGYIVFIAFVLFGLILSQVLHLITGAKR